MKAEDNICIYGLDRKISLARNKAVHNLIKAVSERKGAVVFEPDVISYLFFSYVFSLIPEEKYIDEALYTFYMRDKKAREKIKEDKFIDKKDSAIEFYFQQLISDIIGGFSWGASAQLFLYVVLEEWMSLLGEKPYIKSTEEELSIIRHDGTSSSACMIDRIEYIRQYKKDFGLRLDKALEGNKLFIPTLCSLYNTDITTIYDYLERLCCTSLMPLVSPTYGARKFFSLNLPLLSRLQNLNVSEVEGIENLSDCHFSIEEDKHVASVLKIEYPYKPKLKEEITEGDVERAKTFFKEVAGKQKKTN